jgi:hypothetical protein
MLPLLVLSLAPLSSVAPRLILTSSGLTSPTLESSFRRMLSDISGSRTPRIAQLVTAQMAPSGTPSTGKRTPGQLRQRRWSDARKKGRELEAALGIPVECVDCGRDDKPAELFEEPLAEADCIWVTGGNTFYLWHHMKRSGVDELVRRRVLEDGALYVGCSAGAIVAGSSIRTAYWKGWDDPHIVGDWSTEESLRGMGLVPSKAFFPHFEHAAHAALLEERRGDLGGSTVIGLTDCGEIAHVCGEPTTASTRS